MKRIRLSTLLLLVVIVALGFALFMQGVQSARRVAEMEASRADVEQINMGMNVELQIERVRSRGLELQIQRERARSRGLVEQPEAARKGEH